MSERGVVLTASVGAAGWGVESEVEHAHSEQIKSQASTDRIAPSFGAQGLKYKRFGLSPIRNDWRDSDTLTWSTTGR